MASKFEVKTVFFANKGLVLKRDPGQLQDGELLEASNVISVQEGAITVREGNQRLTGGSSPSGSPQWSLINTISKLHTGTGTDAWYVGNTNGIYRSNGPIPSSGAGMSFTQVAYDVASNSVSDYTKLRWTGIRYNAGTTGTPYEFFACPGKMLKDTGSLVSGDQYNNTPNSGLPYNYGPGSDGTLLQQWGILPPWAPCEAYLDAIIILPNDTSDLMAGVSGATPRISVTVSSVTWDTASGSGPGYVTITPSAMTYTDTQSNINVIESGMLVAINGYVMSVDMTTPTTFSGYYPGTSPSGSIVSAEVYTTAPTAFPNIGPLSVNAAFDGTPENGYVTDDLVHVAIYVSNPNDLSDMRLRVFVGGTNSDGSGSDYYEKAIAISALQSQISELTTPISGMTTVAETINLGVYGNFTIEVPTLTQGSPEQLTPSSPATATSAVWTEIDTPKSSFVAVGNAGAAGKTWMNVTGFQLYYLNTSATTPVIGLSSLYIYGGYGPNNNNTTVNTTQLLPYSYVATYFNSTTGAESNPSIPMIPASGVTAVRQRIAVAIPPTGDPQVSTSELSIKIYRTGGTFADGYYRLIGYATNTGFTGSGTSAVPNNWAVFYDSVSDISIASAPIAYFDNDPPVTSTLQNQYTATISSITVLSGQYVVIKPSIALPSNIRIGSTVTLSSTFTATLASNYEQCIISKISFASGISTFQVYAQYTHYVGDNITIDAVSNQPCTLGCAAFDSIFLAGDPNNPQALYKSKTGRPEAFPLVDIEAQIVNQINVGSPSNPIMAVLEFNGQIVCMNLYKIYTIYVFAGAMQAPVETPANRGLWANFAWCKVDNEIWFLSYDGIYSWSGGSCTKRSEAIDPMFKGYTFGGPLSNAYAPIDMTQASKITFAYYQNKVLINYVDTSGIYHRLTYNTIWNRWAIDTINDPLNTQSPSSLAITAQYLEPDSGNFLLAKTMEYLSQFWAFLYLDNVGTSDGWVNTGTGGAVINWAITPAYYTLGLPSVQKNFSDIDIEFANDSSAFNITAYYDFGSLVTDAFSIAAGLAQGRRRLELPINSGYGRENYAMALRFYGGTTVPLTLYSLTFNYYLYEQLQTGRPFDWDDLEHEYDKRLYEVAITHDVLSGQSVTLNLDIETGLNGAQTVTAAYQTFTLLPVTNPGVGPARMTSNFPISDGTVVKRIRLRPSTTATNAPFKLWWDYKFKFEKYPPDIVPFTEYSDYGYNYDKCFHVLWLNVDTNGINVPVSIQADGNTNVQTVTVNGTFNNRTIPFPVNVDVIGKLVRLFVGTIPSGGKFQLFDHHFEFEKFPPDTIYYTEYKDFGYPYLKYLQQLVLDVNTNGHTVPVQVIGDGTVLQTVNVTSTIQTRDQRFTLNPQLGPANKVRLVVPSGTFPTGARFQLWSWDVIHEKADLGPVTHSYDWDAMGSAFDKQLQEITFRYDNNSQGPVTMLVDTETGINGGTINIAAYSFVLNQTGRAIQTFAFPDYQYCKQIRVYPQSDFVTWRNWKHSVVAVKQPPDIVEFTDWSNLGYPCQKIARNLLLDINTNNVAATVNLLADGSTVQSFPVTTTQQQRYVILACNSNLIGVLWKLELTPGTGGATQLYAASLDYLTEPCAVNYVDTYEQDFGYTGFKFIKQIWVHYTSTAIVTLSIYVQGDTLFYQYTLPAQSTRDIVRFYLPAINGGVLNKSKTYRATLSSTGTFKLYADSRIDYGMFGRDQMAAFAITSVNPETQLPVAGPHIGAWKLSSASQTVPEGVGAMA
jgi:hypothetical protein